MPCERFQKHAGDCRALIAPQSPDFMLTNLLIYFVCSRVLHWIGFKIWAGFDNDFDPDPDFEDSTYEPDKQNKILCFRP
jgi:hypothetical protein